MTPEEIEKAAQELLAVAIAGVVIGLGLIAAFLYTYLR